MSLFVVLEEGGEYHDLSLGHWLIAWRRGVPILGVCLLGHRLIYDRIMRDHGWGWFRTRRI